MQPSRSHHEYGFSLLEVLVAVGLIAVLVASLSPLFAVATASNAAARGRTVAALLAEEKLEELRELTFGFGLLGAPTTDQSTDTSGTVTTEGGSGLTPSPANSLDQSVSGYSDQLDLFGRRTDVARMAFVRRWSIQALPSDPANGIVVRVVVLPRRDANARGSSARLADAVRLVTVRTRKAR